MTSRSQGWDIGGNPTPTRDPLAPRVRRIYSLTWASLDRADESCRPQGWGTPRSPTPPICRRCGWRLDQVGHEENCERGRR
jgi:hypothetical protein